VKQAHYNAHHIYIDVRDPHNITDPRQTFFLKFLSSSLDDDNKNEIKAIYVLPEFQGHGIGSSLVKNLKHLAKDYLKLESIHIEVYEGCPGIPILLDQGFTEIIRQEKFVRLEGEYLARMVYEVQL
jgi:GNAT superfamily N-acetyltransferase